MQNDDKIKKAKIDLIKSILIDLNNIDTVKLLSLLSLVFKENFQNDEIVQNFEVYFLREKNYAITTLKSLIELIKSHNKKKENIENGELLDIMCNIITDINNEISSENIQCYEKIIDTIDNSIKNNSNLIKKYTSKTNQQIEIAVEKKKQYTITPTSGIKLLNNNPYSFFIEKVLGLKSVNEWSHDIDAKLYGSIAHKIMEEFHKKYRYMNFNDKNNKNELEKIFLNTITEVLNIVNSNNIFLQQKLKKIKNIAIQMENDAYKNNRLVFVEYPFFTIINSIKVWAKADRVEIDNKNKEIYIFDFKTSLNKDKKKNEENGSDTQLLIIAMLILKQSSYKDYKIKQMKYINLSGKNRAEDVEIDISYLENTENNIKRQIETYFSNGKPNVENMIYIRQDKYQLYDNDIATMKLYREFYI